MDEFRAFYPNSCSFICSATPTANQFYEHMGYCVGHMPHKFMVKHYCEGSTVYVPIESSNAALAIESSVSVICFVI